MSHRTRKHTSKTHHISSSSHIIGKIIFQETTCCASYSCWNTCYAMEERDILSLTRSSDDAIGPRDFLKNHICSLMAFHPKVLNPALIFFQVILFIFSLKLSFFCFYLRICLCKLPSKSQKFS